VLAFGATALVLAGVFGALSWKERLGKGVVLASLAIMVAAGATILVLAELIPVPGRQAQAERARRLAELEQAKIAAHSASTASPDAEPSPSRSRQFVRLVAGPEELTFQGEPTTWERLPELLEGVTNRAQTVFEFATAPDDFTVTQVDELQEQAGRLSRQFGFEYLSHVGSHPLGTLGTATSPREVVDQWLSHVKANRMKAMWDLTTRESGGAGSVDLRQTWEFDTIKAFTLARSDSLAMVVTTRYKDNAGRERMVLFSLTNRDGRWLIRDNAVGSPDHAESRLGGFTEHPGVIYDVRREDVIGRWTQAFFSPATFRFEADGGFSMSYRIVGGARTNLHGTWQLEADRLTYLTGAGSRTGQVVRVREDFFQLKHADGNLSGFQRMKEEPYDSEGVN
jgi:hypothetical protein